MSLSDHVFERIRNRLVGLTDQEYFWEPAPGCWSVRPGPDGRWINDGMLPAPEPAPVTTIAWRLWHLIDLYGEDRAHRSLGVPPQGPAVGLDDPHGEPPHTAAEALVLLDRAHDRWDDHLGLVTDEQLSESVGPAGGGSSERTKAAYVLHMLDEFVHHGAEIALLRDLWGWQHPLDPDVIAEQVMRGDVSVLADVDVTIPDHARLLPLAAQYSRWDIVSELVDRGMPVDTTGRTTLHMAAAAGRLDLARLLVENGADVTAKDPDFHVAPVEWARFFDRADVIAYLESC